MELLIRRGVDTPIRPKDIDVDSTFVHEFEKRDAEVAAYWIVRYCQSRRSWLPFNLEKLARFCAAHYPPSVNTFELLANGVTELVVQDLVRNDKKVLTLTAKFVARCYAASPLPRLPKKRGSRSPRKPSKTRLEHLLSEEDIA